MKYYAQKYNKTEWAVVNSNGEARMIVVDREHADFLADLLNAQHNKTKPT